MSAGFVASDKVRQTVFLAIVHGAGDLETIAKRHRILRPAAERSAKELAAQGLVAEAGGKWAPTEAGREVERELKTMR